MRRRAFITFIGGAAAWPFAARAQQGERMRRVGALMAQAADDPTSAVRIAAFAQGLQELGWLVGSNVRIDYRWATSDADRAHYAADWLRSRQTSFWPHPARRSVHCNRRAALCRSCS
jgi:putative tryptophan/tyrosine transport system substrate-binding protein